MSDDDTSTGEGSDSKGVFITEGVEFTVHGIKITMGPHGVEASHDGVSLRQDLCKHWLAIAVGHTIEAKHANDDLVATEARGEDKGLGEPLEREFRASMQAMVAAVVAIDAFYAAVIEREPLPDDLKEKWRNKRTSRWKQQREAFRRAFKLSAEGVKTLRPILKDMMKYRGWAVHPPAGRKPPHLHPDINRGVDWRFVAFRSANAIEFTRGSLALVYRLTEKGLEIPSLSEYCKYLHGATSELAASWYSQFPDYPATAAQHESSAGSAD